VSVVAVEIPTTANQVNRVNAARTAPGNPLTMSFLTTINCHISHGSVPLQSQVFRNFVFVLFSPAPGNPLTMSFLTTINCHISYGSVPCNHRFSAILFLSCFLLYKDMKKQN